MWSMDTGFTGVQVSSTGAPATTAIAVIFSDKSHASRYAIIPPLEWPITHTRDVSTEYREATKSITVDANSKSFSFSTVAFGQQFPAFHEVTSSWTEPLRPATIKFLSSAQERILESVKMVFVVDARLCNASSRGVEVVAEYRAGILR
jgi:hypothetical protein